MKPAGLKPGLAREGNGASRAVQLRRRAMTGSRSIWSDRKPLTEKETMHYLLIAAIALAVIAVDMKWGDRIAAWLMRNDIGSTEE